MGSEAVFPLTWDLERFFKEKGQKEDFTRFVKDISEKLSALDPLVKHPSSLAEAISLSQEIAAKSAELGAFIHCLLAEDTTNSHALRFQGDLQMLQARFENLSTLLDETLRTLDEKGFHALLKNPLCQNLSFPLCERKDLAQDKLPYELESLITNLSIDGYHGYSQLFYVLHGKLKFPMNDEKGSLEHLSISQIDNKIASKDRRTRVQAFSIYKQIFKEHESHFAEVLNHIGGFRLQVYEKRGWDHVLKEPLTANRMHAETLSSMWKAIKTHISPFVDFLNKKASLLGLKKLSWHDVDTPITKSTLTIPYQEASEFIIKQFEKYSPKMGIFSRRALQDGWVEAEDRKNKSAGGFCVGLPLKKESRIFMTYSGTQYNVATLAHELGHAYHNEIIFAHPYFAQNIKMNVAETASTMAEMIVSDAALSQATRKEHKIALLDDKISRSIAFFMNIHARFIFEQAFYQERKEGYVLPERLCSLMEAAQREAFGDALEEWHPHFWASKMHFYFTDVPFYNFPYTFGYLFSLGIYTLLKHDTKAFEKRYDAILYDTPLMTSEELAKKHLNVDLTKTTFWEMAVKEAVKDVSLFDELVHSNGSISSKQASKTNKNTSLV